MKPLVDLYLTQGWKSVVDKYGSYNVKQYLSEFGLSSTIIDFIGLLFGIETNLFTSLISHFRDVLLINEKTKFYHIIGGNQRLIEKLIDSYTIRYSTTVLSIERHRNQTVSVQTKDSNGRIQIDIFDFVVVATTAPAARLIRYLPINKQIQDLSRSLRQLHYDCASKIVLYFNRSWWHDEGIFGGMTITDLPIRFVYYDNYRTSFHQNNQSVLLASYTFSQDATFWSSSTLEQITNEVLNNLEEIHSRNDIRHLHRKTLVKHWCHDPFSHGAYALFLPFQEQQLMPILMQSIENRIFFAGEHLSTAHAWVEGAILSALRVVMQMQEESFDIVIVGNDLLALQTARTLSQLKPSWHILLLTEIDYFSNENFTIRQNERLLDYSNHRILTDRGTIIVKHKILFLDQNYHLKPDTNRTIIDYLSYSNINLFDI